MLDTGGLRVYGMVKIHMRKLQKQLNLPAQATDSRKVRVGLLLSLLPSLWSRAQHYRPSVQR